MRPRSGPLAALPPTGSARAPRRYATRSPRATEQGKRPAGWQVRFIGWSASPVKSENSATRRVLILPKVLVLTDLNVPFGRQRLLLGVLRVLDVAVLCLGLEVVPGSAGSPPGSALHPARQNGTLWRTQCSCTCHPGQPGIPDIICRSIMQLGNIAYVAS